jgi:phosphatidylinositol alpha-1,6-mannosyltransferase
VKRALLITEVFPPQTGGSGRWLYELYRRLPAGSVVVAAGEYPGAEGFDRGQMLPIERLPLTFPSWAFFSLANVRNYGLAFSRLTDLIHRRRPASLHCGKLLPEGWLAWLVRLRTGLPYWIYVHGEELQQGWQSRELGWMMRRVFASASGIIANSQNTTELLRRDWRVPAAKLHTLNPGVDAGRFCPARRDAAVRRRLGWGERPVVLTVGRLQKRKGQDMLIRALVATRQRVPDVLYSIVGDGQERGALEKMVAEHGLAEHVELRGEPNDAELIERYQQCDLFALPNRTVDGDFEGFGMVLVEAQACGRPVIAGDSGGTRETMDVGRTGLIVDCTRPEPLAEAVCGLLLDGERRQRMGQAAREHVVSTFDWPQLAGRAAEILGLATEASEPVEPASVRRCREAVVA